MRGLRGQTFVLEKWYEKAIFYFHLSITMQPCNDAAIFTGEPIMAIRNFSRIRASFPYGFPENLTNLRY